jgi:hypothetical protein
MWMLQPGRIIGKFGSPLASAPEHYIDTYIDTLYQHPYSAKMAGFFAPKNESAFESASVCDLDRANPVDVAAARYAEVV